eukprot:15485259-Alexandrium_andersonii.AAC.2
MIRGPVSDGRRQSLTAVSGTPHDGLRRQSREAAPALPQERAGRELWRQSPSLFDPVVMSQGRATWVPARWAAAPPNPPLLVPEGCHPPGPPRLAPQACAGGARWGGSPPGRRRCSAGIYPCGPG